MAEAIAFPLSLTLFAVGDSLSRLARLKRALIKTARYGMAEAMPFRCRSLCSRRARVDGLIGTSERRALIQTWPCTAESRALSKAKIPAVVLHRLP